MLSARSLVIFIVCLASFVNLATGIRVNIAALTNSLESQAVENQTFASCETFQNRVLGPYLGSYLGPLTHIGSGANGEVCAGRVVTKILGAPGGTKWVPRVGSTVAIKGSCLDENEYYGNAFLKEASMMAYLTNTLQIPQVVKSWEASYNTKLRHCSYPKKMVFVGMEYIDGGDFDGILSDKVQSTPYNDAHLFLDALKGVLAMLRKGFVHRDLKPANLMVVPGVGAKVTDFGSTCCVAQEACKAVPRLQCGSTKFGVGNTPYFMSPELYEDKPPHYTHDLFAMGLIAYEMYVHQDNSRFFSWFYDNPSNIASLMWKVLDHGARQKKIWNDPRLGDVSSFYQTERRTPMRQFLSDLLDVDPRKRDKAVGMIADQTPCEKLDWCKQWASMQAYPGPHPDEGNQNQFQAPQLSQQQELTFRTYLSLSMMSSVGPESIPQGNGFADLRN